MTEFPEQLKGLYRAIAEHSSDIITVLAPDATIRYESPSIRRILGYDPDELVGRSALELVHPEDRDAVAKELEAGLEDPEAVRRVAYRCRHADGSWVYLESNGRRMPEDAEVDGFLVHSRDVTPRKELEKHLRDARRMETVARLVSGIAHDFNNLLTVIRGNTDLLLEDVEEGHLRHAAVGEIRDAAERAASLTRDLLAFAGQENLRLRTIDVGAGLEEMRPDIESLLGDSVNLEMDLDPGPARIRVDPELAREVTLELVSNARDAMADGGTLRIVLRKLRVEPDSPVTQRGVEPGDWIAVGYSDEGTGMSERVRERAFQPFFSTKDQASGLGLSTVYGLVKQTGGEIWIDSAPGEGTTVWTYLPDAGAPDR